MVYPGAVAACVSQVEVSAKLSNQAVKTRDPMMRIGDHYVRSGVFLFRRIEGANDGLGLVQGKYLALTWSLNSHQHPLLWTQPEKQAHADSASGYYNQDDQTDALAFALTETNLDFALDSQRSRIGGGKLKRFVDFVFRVFTVTTIRVQQLVDCLIDQAPGHYLLQHRLLFGKLVD